MAMDNSGGLERLTPWVLWAKWSPVKRVPNTYHPLLCHLIDVAMVAEGVRYNGHSRALPTFVGVNHEWWYEARWYLTVPHISGGESGMPGASPGMPLFASSRTRAQGVGRQFGAQIGLPLLTSVATWYTFSTDLAASGEASGISGWREVEGYGGPRSVRDVPAR